MQGQRLRAVFQEDGSLLHHLLVDGKGVLSGSLLRGGRTLEGGDGVREGLVSANHPSAEGRRDEQCQRKDDRHHFPPGRRGRGSKAPVRQKP